MTRAIRALRRVLSILGVAALCAGAGSALLASPAHAGWVDIPNGGLLVSFTSNVTPYTWTLVAAYSQGGWWGGESPASTLQPGDSPRYVVQPWQTRTPGICFGNNAFDYNAYLTYKVDVLGGPPEYANVVIWGSWTDNYCLGRSLGGPVVDPGFAVYFTSSPPPAGYDPNSVSGAAPGPQIADPQLTYQHNAPNLFDQTIEAVGDYTVDASTNLGAPFVNVLNTLCSGAASTSCSFTQQGPLTWGTGDAGSPWVGTHCGAGSSNFSVSYTAAQTATLSVGGSLTVGAEFTLFDVESNSIEVSVEASRQVVPDQVGDPNGLDGHPGGGHRLSVGDTDGGQGGRNAGRLQRVGDVHGEQLHAGAQWGEQGQPHARVRRGDQGAADDPRGAAEPLRRLCRLDATRSEGR